MTRSRTLVTVLLVAVALAAIGYGWRLHLSSQERPGSLQLTDEIECFYTAGTRVSAASRTAAATEIRVDGDALIRQRAPAATLIVRTRLLIITARGAAEFRVTGRSNEAGEQVEVLEGAVEARKAYPSPYPEPDQLGPGEMSMINQTIDLMEKERTDVAALRAWRDALIASVAKARETSRTVD